MVSFISGGNFINRREELILINSAFDALIDKKRLLRTPIIDFFGVDGIGKTSMLQEVKQRCLQKSLFCIWINANQSPSGFFLQLLQQIGKTLFEEDLIDLPEATETLYTLSVNAMKSRLQHEPVVFLLDEVDADNEEMDWIENILHDLIDNPHFFVVLASQQQVSFEKHRSVARKLISHQLKPFDQDACKAYISDIAGGVDPAIQEEIISWASGFPLAMKVMSRIVQEQKLDPRVLEDQKQLISSLMEEVVNHGIFARVPVDQLQWCKEYVRLLSIPRRFNLVILQKLTETFAPSLRLAGKLEYLGLPRRINQGTDILYWDMRKSGFTINDTVRHLFFRQYAIEQPDIFYNIHRFLATQNRQFAQEVNGSDRIRYLREYLYHSTFIENRQALAPLLEQVMQEIAKESFDSFVQFSEELQQDKELQDVLGPNLSFIQNFVDATFKKEDNQ